jgi:hypothetical protein
MERASTYGRPPLKTIGINPADRIIGHIPPDIRVSRLEPDGVFAEPAGDDGVVPAVEVVLQAGVDVEGAGGVAEEEGVGAVADVDDVSEGIVDDVGFDGGGLCGGVVEGDVAGLGLDARRRLFSRGLLA